MDPWYVQWYYELISVGSAPKVFPQTVQDVLYDYIVEVPYTIKPYMLLLKLNTALSTKSIENKSTQEQEMLR